MKVPFVRVAAAGLLVATPLAFAHCDHAVEAPPDEAPTVAHEPLMLGRVVLDSADYQPVANAQLVLDYVDLDLPSDEQALPAIELTTDADGLFAIDAIPIEQGEVTVNVFLDGEFADSEIVAIEDGQPVKKIIGFVVTTWVVCVATAWVSGMKVSGSDKMKHCVASCRSTRWCGGPATGWTAGILKELFDSMCSKGPQWLKDLLKPVSGCSGWDNADLDADGRGIWCAAKWKTCESCCNDYY